MKVNINYKEFLSSFIKILLKYFVDEQIDDFKATETVEDAKKENVDDSHENGEVNGKEDQNEQDNNYERPSSFTSKK